MPIRCREYRLDYICHYALSDDLLLMIHFVFVTHTRADDTRVTIVKEPALKGNNIWSP